MEIFDLHCDTITECFKNNEQLDNCGRNASLRYVAPCRRWCQTFAVFVPDDLRGREAYDYFCVNLNYFREQLDRYSHMIAQVEKAADIAAILDSGRCAALLAIEGGSAIGNDISNIERFAGLGVKSIGLTWNARNELGGGFDYEGGLTGFGVEAVKEMERCGIVVDVSHLNDRGFDDLLSVATRPFIASHSNSRVICPHKRNLSDEHFRAIKKLGGIVGINFYEAFLHEKKRDNAPGLITEHISHFLSLGGEDVVALGSDFDGASISETLNSVGKLDNLYEYMLKSRVPEYIIKKIFFNNAYNFYVKYESAQR